MNIFHIVKINRWLLSAYLVTCLAAGACAFESPIPFWQWKATCDSTVAHYVDTVTRQGSPAYDYRASASSYQVFVDTIQTSIDTCCDSLLTDATCWIDGACLTTDFFETSFRAFIPYFQGLRVPEHARLIFIGDRHGDVRSTLSMMQELANQGILDQNNPFKIAADDVYIIGLGDYVDRGNAGVETMLTMLWLKLTNPDRVVLVRGNHENMLHGINQSHFQQELRSKFGALITQERIEQISRIYDMMPVALFIASGYNPTTIIIACHGFLELGTSPEKLCAALVSLKDNEVRFQLMGPIDRAAQAKRLPADLADAVSGHAYDELYCAQPLTLNSPMDPFFLGWMHHFVSVDHETPILSFDYNNVWVWGKMLANSVLDSWSDVHGNYRLRGIVRGHQHGCNEWYALYPAMMDALWKHSGLYQSWTSRESQRTVHDGMVLTCAPAPDNEYAGYSDPLLYPGFNYDTWLVLTTAPRFEQWHISTVQKTMFNPRNVLCKTLAIG